MFYDIEDPNKFCSDINSLLNKNGIWMLELLSTFIKKSNI